MLITINIIFSSFFFLASFGNAEEIINSSEQNFLNKIKRCVKDKQTGCLTNLHYYPGATDISKAREQDLMLWKEIIYSNIEAIELEPLEENFQSKIVSNCTSIQLNLDPIGYISFHYQTESTGEVHAKWPFARKDGKFYFPSSIIVPADPQSPNYIGVRVFGDQPVNFKGSIEISKAGKISTEAIEGTTDFKASYCGEYLEYLKISGENTFGKYKLIINEEGQALYDSGLYIANVPITYKRYSNQALQRTR